MHQLDGFMTFCIFRRKKKAILGLPHRNLSGVPGLSGFARNDKKTVSSSLHRQATIDTVLAAGHIGSIIRKQKQCHGCRFIG